MTPRRPSPGTKLISSPVMNAGFQGDLVDVVNWWKREGRGRGAGTGSLSHPLSWVWVRNNSGADQDLGAVLEINGIDIDAANLDQYHLQLAGGLRSGNDPSCCILLEHTPDEELGRALVAGVCLASVDVIDSDNTHARVVAGDETLRGDFGGLARIVWKPSGTGVKQCVVQLPSDGMNIVRFARSTSTITAGSTGTADVYVNGAARGSVTVYYNRLDAAGNVASGEDIYIQYFHDLDQWHLVGAECGA